MQAMPLSVQRAAEDVLAHLAFGICLEQHNPGHALLKVTKVGV